MGKVDTKPILRPKVKDRTLPRKFPGINVIQEGRNDGVRVCLIVDVFMGKPVDKIAFFRIYEEKTGIFWKPRPIKTKGRNKPFNVWDVVSIDRNKAEELAEAILDLARGKEAPKEVKRGAKQKEVKDEIMDIAKDYDFGG